jgi:hypothetical protein
MKTLANGENRSDGPLVSPRLRGDRSKRSEIEGVRELRSRPDRTAAAGSFRIFEILVNPFDKGMDSVSPFRYYRTYVRELERDREELG